LVQLPRASGHRPEPAANGFEDEDQPASPATHLSRQTVGLAAHAGIRPAIRERAFGDDVPSGIGVARELISKDAVGFLYG
jgi:hypothetical protein